MKKQKELITLDELMLGGRRLKAAWITDHRFADLYMGRNGRVISFYVIKPHILGAGSFTNLVGEIRKLYPKYAIEVINVYDDRFKAHLLKMGFEATEINSCFVLSSPDIQR